MRVTARQIGYGHRQQVYGGYQVKNTAAGRVRGASVALGGLMALVAAAVPSAQAQVCEFSRDDDPAKPEPDTFRDCVDQANGDAVIDTVRGGGPSTVSLTLGKVFITSSMTLDVKISPACGSRPRPSWIFNARLFMPQRISVTPPAIQTFVPAGNAIMPAPRS